MTSKEKTLASEFLSNYSDDLGNNGCNDWEFPEHWTLEEKQSFAKRYNEWNGTPEEYDPDSLYIPDFAVSAFLAELLMNDVRGIES